MPDQSPGQVRRARFASQHLTDDTRLGPSPADVASAICGIQAQVPAVAALALRARSRGLVAEDASHGLSAERSIVRRWLMRGTLHVAVAQDVRWLLRGRRRDPRRPRRAWTADAPPDPGAASRPRRSDCFVGPGADPPHRSRRPAWCHLPGAATAQRRHVCPPR